MEVILFSDGGARPNPGYSGAGFFASDSEEQAHIWWKSFPSLTGTNNTAELEAALGAFKKANELGWKKVLLRPDSQYTIGALDNREKYKANDFTTGGEPIKNVDIIKALIDEVDKFLATGGKYATQWVKGHSGIVENERADQMATRGVIAAQKGKAVEVYETTPLKKYDKFKSADYDRLFDSSHMYFTIAKLMGADDRHVYFTGHHGKDDSDADKKGKVDTSFGKTLPEAVQCILFMKKPSEVVDIAIREQLCLSPNTGTMPYIINLAQLHSPKTHHEITAYDGLYLHIDKKMSQRGEQVMVDTWGNKVARLHNPPKLGMLAMSKMEHLGAECEKYLVGKPHRYQETDVTDLLFTLEEKKLKNKTVEELQVSSDLLTKGVVTAKVKYLPDSDETIEVRLNIAHELYTTNGMRSLRKDNPKVKVLTWTSGELGVRYLLHFSTDTGDAFRMPVASNLVFTKPKPQQLSSIVSKKKTKKKK